MTDYTPDIIFKNRDYLIVNKPAGQLSLSGQSSDEGQSIHERLSVNAKKPIHILSRLDRPVSGLMIISKSKYFHKHYLKQQQEGLVAKTYVCIVEGKWDSKSGFLEDFHYHDKKHKKARITEAFLKKESKVSLHYEILCSLEKYTVLLVTIKNGKFHQIRAQLANCGNPVKGDVKYGARRGNKDRSIHMHASKISFIAIDKNQIEHSVDLPQSDSLWKLATEALINKEQDGKV